MSYIVKTNHPPVGSDVAVGDRFTFIEKPYYDGHHIAKGDEVFIWFSEIPNGIDIPKGQGLAGIGEVNTAQNRDNGRIEITLTLTDMTSNNSMSINDLEPYRNVIDGEPVTEIARKLYRHSHNKVAYLAEGETELLRRYFR